MNVAMLFRMATAHGLVLGLKDEALVVKTATGATVPVEVRERLREHRDELVEHLHFREQALDLLAASAGRIADCYVVGVTLDTTEGRRLDMAINDAFWDSDAEGLAAAVEAYERYALLRFTGGQREA